MGVMEERCPVSFWRWAAPVVAGNFAALGASYIARKAAAGRHPTTISTISLVTGASAFWLVGGLTWVAIKPPEALPCPQPRR